MFAKRSPSALHSAHFARSNGSGGITSRDALTLDRIRQVAPSVFADNRHVSRSERYTYIPTSQIVDSAAVALKITIEAIF